MADTAALIAALQPVLETLRDLDPADADAASTLARRHPLDSEDLRQVRVLLEDGLEEGWLCPKENAGIRFGRVAKAGKGTDGFSIDAVEMAGPGPGHTHPQGEFDLCFDLDGAPRFDGNAPGWTVYPPNSWHVPTVEGGRMVILYFLPAGEIRFEPRPSA